jgi:hypothetical protein
MASIAGRLEAAVQHTHTRQIPRLYGLRLTLAHQRALGIMSLGILALAVARLVQVLRQFLFGASLASAALRLGPLAQLGITTGITSAMEVVVAQAAAAAAAGY